MSAATACTALRVSLLMAGCPARERDTVDTEMPRRSATSSSRTLVAFDRRFERALVCINLHKRNGKRGSYRPSLAADVERDESIVFDPDQESKWQRALAKLGVDLTLLSSDAGHA